MDNSYLRILFGCVAAILTFFYGLGVSSFVGGVISLVHALQAETKDTSLIILSVLTLLLCAAGLYYPILFGFAFGIMIDSCVTDNAERKWHIYLIIPLIIAVIAGILAGIYSVEIYENMPGIINSYSPGGMILGQ